MELHNGTMQISDPNIYYIHDTAVLENYRCAKIGIKEKRREERGEKRT
jgi:hypothetical protein